jgi:1,2-diacylglycerol 3-beta-galactosyltransferase
VATRTVTEPTRLLFLVGDTGGGHRSAANAVRQALSYAYPGRFATVISDPLLGPGAPWRLRWLMRLYGPAIRLAPWLWGVLWRGYNSPRVLGWARRTMLRPAYRSVAAAVAAHQPAVIVAFHSLTAEPALRARDSGVPAASLVTVITDLVTAHLSWRDAAADRIIVPSAPVRHQCRLDGMAEGRYTEIGLPVAAEFAEPPASPPGRAALQRALGLRGGRFLVVVTGGAEGSGRIYQRTAAILRHCSDVDVAVICGRNDMLRRRLTRLAARAEGRLTVRGFVDNMPGWLRCADVVVGKAGPGTIAEAACCGAPMLLTSFLPGQEEGNADFVASAGAGRYVPGLTDLVTEIERLRRDPGALAAMRQASAAISRPGAAADIARLVASLAGTEVGQAPAAAAGDGRGEHYLQPHSQKPEVLAVLPKPVRRVAGKARRDLTQADGPGRRAKTTPRRRKLGKTLGKPL